MDATRVPAPPPATEGWPDAASVIAAARHSIAGLAHYADDDPALPWWAHRHRVMLREIDRLAAENERLREALRKIAALKPAEEPDLESAHGGGNHGDIEEAAADGAFWHVGLIAEAALAPRPAAPAAEGGGA